MLPSDLELAQLYEWIDRYESFEVPGDDTYLVFTGAGSAVAGEEQHQRVWDWVAAFAAEGAATAGE